MEISLYGGTGFVGSSFVNKYKTVDNICVVPRWCRRPNPYTKSDLLYTISTTHNYNVFDDATLDVNTNLMVFTETLDSWRRNNPEGIFNFISSWFVYGDTELPAREDYSCNPRGFYSITKRCAEQLLVSYAETFGLNYRILRLCNILGNADKNVSAKKNALQYLINRIKTNQPIEIYERGEFFRSYMHIEDCVDAIHLVMETGKLNDIYNIGIATPLKFIDAINYVHKKCESTSKIEFIEQKEFHKKVQAKSFYMDVSKLYLLGFSPKYTPNMILDSLID